MPAKIVLTDTDNLINRYQSGSSVKQLAAERGVNRAIIARTLQSLNIPLRGRSDAEREKWRIIKQSRHAIERQLGKAWAAARGRTVSVSTKLKHAETISRKLLQVTALEKSIALDLERLGFMPNLQHVIASYNVDIAIHKERIAVEVQSAYLHGGKSMKPQRLNDIMDSGWDILVLYTPRRNGPYTPSELAKYIVAFMQAVRCNPSAQRQYGVIRGDGKPVPHFCNQLNHRARVKGF